MVALWVTVSLTFILSLIASANNLSVCIGGATGSRIVSYRTGVLISLIGFLIGLYLEGWKLKPAQDMLIAIQVASPIIVVSTIIAFSMSLLTKVPVSLVQSLFGSMIGVMLGLGYEINFDYVVSTMSFWALAPILSILIAGLWFRGYHIVKLGSLWTRLTILKLGLVASSFYSAYVFGANNLGFIAFILNPSPYTYIIIYIGSIIGTLLLGKRFMLFIGEKIYTMKYSSAFHAQVTGVSMIMIATQLGIPASIAQVVTGGIVGTGLGHRVRILNVSALKTILIQWTLSPSLGIIIGFLMAYFLII